MRCDCCDVALSNYESSLKSKSTGEYLNTCLKCLNGLNIPYIGNKALVKDNPETGKTYDSL